MQSSERTQLKINIKAMMSIGAKVLEQLEKEEKPPTPKQVIAIDRQAQLLQRILTKKSKPQGLKKKPS